MIDPATASSIGELLVQWLPLITSTNPAVAHVLAETINESTAVAAVEASVSASKGLVAVRQRLLAYAKNPTKPPENHDLQRAVYISFLCATEVIYESRLAQLGQKIDLSWFAGLKRELLSKLPDSSTIVLDLNASETQNLNRALAELREELAGCEMLSAEDLQGRMPFNIEVNTLRGLISLQSYEDALLDATLTHSKWYKHSSGAVRGTARENLWPFMARFFAEEIKSNDRVSSILTAQMLADTGVSLADLKTDLGEVASNVRDIKSLIEHRSNGPSYLAPSFEELTYPVEPCAKADRFLDAMPPTLSDIAASFDIPRRVYVERDGVRDSVVSCLAQDAGSLLVSISGPSGAGKSVLATRLAYDCLQRGYKVFKLLPDWECSDSIGIQIRRVLDFLHHPAVFVFDGASTLIRKGLKPQDIFRTVKSARTSVVLVFIENWLLFPPAGIGNNTLDPEESKCFSVLQLTTGELASLLDRIIDLETSGRVNEVRCHISREKRLALCSDYQDRLAAAALLILRYGRRVADILADEFNAIESEAVRTAYILTVLCSGLGISVPKAIISKILKGRNILQPVDFWKRLLQITADSNNAISLRHPRFYQCLAPLVIPEPRDRADLLVEIISYAKSNEEGERSFLLDMFGRRKRISEVLLRSKESISEWIVNVAHCLPEMSIDCQRSGYVCLAQIERDSLHEFERADKFFKAAISSDPAFAYAYRQRSWNLLRAGLLQEAEGSANEAAQMFPDDAKTLLDSACVLQYCSAEGFRRAGQYFMSALKIESEETELRAELLKRIERYQAADAIRKYYIRDDNGLPDQVLEELKAPWYLWTLTRRVQSALKRELGSLLREIDADPDRTEDVIQSVRQRKDDVLEALIKANRARLEYQQWYHAGATMDRDAVEELFVKAATILQRRNAESEPFVRTWYGTFLKEVRLNYVTAEREYRQAIDHAEHMEGRNKEYPLRNEPMLLNNLALLLMHAVRIQVHPKSALHEAERLLNTAIGEVARRQSKFLWPLQTAEELRLLKAELSDQG